MQISRAVAYFQSGSNELNDKIVVIVICLFIAQKKKPNPVVLVMIAVYGIVMAMVQ